MAVNQPVMPATTESLRPWAEFLAPLLWPGSSVTWPGRGGGHRLEYGLVQVPRHPLLLVPATAPDAAAAAVRRYSRGVSTYLKVSRTALAGLISVLPPSLFPRRRLCVDGGVSVEDYLRDVLNRGDLVAAMTLAGRPRPHKTPVLHLLDSNGVTLGFAKVGWNITTRQMVRREKSFLERAPRYRYVAVPRVVHHGAWRDIEVLVTTPLGTGKRVGRAEALYIPALREVASTWGTWEATLTDTRFWHGLRHRLGTDRSGRLLGVVDALEKRLRGVSVSHGTWHGDWRQSNMAIEGGVLQVWDWERWASDVPVGFDPLHFLFQRSFWADGASVAEAINRCGSQSRRYLDALGVRFEVQEAVLTAYLVEVLARHVALADRQTTEPRVDELRKDLVAWLSKAAS